MIDGSAFQRLLQSEKHDATSFQEICRMVEAYSMPSDEGCYAASQTDLHLNVVLLYHRHSICDEPRFCSTFQARLNAFRLRSQILSDRWRQGGTTRHLFHCDNSSHVQAKPTDRVRQLLFSLI